MLLLLCYATFMLCRDQIPGDSSRMRGGKAVGCQVVELLCPAPDYCTALVVYTEMVSCNYRAEAICSIYHISTTTTTTANDRSYSSVANATGLTLQPKGRLVGRPLVEALKGGPRVRSVARVIKSEAAANGFTTVLDYQEADGRRYFDAAGMPGRVYGLKP